MRECSSVQWMRRGWFLLVFLVWFAGVGCGFSPVGTGTVREGTLAVAVKVSDAATGKALEGAVVHVLGGWKYHIASGTSRENGEYSFVKVFREGRYLAPFPDRVILDVWKEGYRRKIVVFRTEDYIHRVGATGMFKEIEVPLTPGRGSEKLDLTGGAP